VGDELNPSEASAVAALAAEVRSLDPGHPLLYVGMASSNLSRDLQPFESIANVVGADIYPIGTGGTTQSVGPVANTVQQLSHAGGTLSAMVLQAFSWSEYPSTPSFSPRWPTEAEMQSMRDQALAANPSMILWYSIHDVLRSDDPAGHWRDLVQAAFAPAPASASSPQPRVRPRRLAARSSRRRPRAAASRLMSRRHRRRLNHRHHRRRHRTKHHHHKHRRHRQHRRPLLTSLDSLLLF
jgi:hypothetical protein